VDVDITLCPSPLAKETFDSNFYQPSFFGPWGSEGSGCASNETFCRLHQWLMPVLLWTLVRDGMGKLDARTKVGS